MRVAFFQRRPDGNKYSIERLFADIRQSLPNDIRAMVAESRYVSRGVCRRLYCMVEAAFHQGDVNHITGDIHFVTILLRKNRTLLTIHDLDFVERRKGWRWQLSFLLWYWLPIKRCAIVTVISQATKQDLLKYIDVTANKIRVVPDCVSDVFQPCFKDVANTKPIVLQVGTKANKNLLRVVQALAGLDVHLRIVGQLANNQVEVLDQSNIEYSHVCNLTTQEIQIEYQSCDLLVFASTFEGFGLPILEAQATARPVVTSNVWSMPEVAGQAACLVDPYDATSIRSGVLRVLNDSEYRNELVKRGLENCRRFRPAIVAEQYAKIYRELYARRK